ncbi:MAG: hybrid sensor histidine kinase/response regulator [Gammaproteobacteria bacterium]|nr:hybrid sensor histidine kinase/response regulator [Gammaproteobacteria bacterium]
MSDYGSMSMIELFRMEVEGQLDWLSDHLLPLEKEPQLAVTQWEGLMRAAHSIKGAARMVKIGAVTRLSHAMEDYFVAAQRGEVELSIDGVDFLLKLTDKIRGIVVLDEDDLMSYESRHEGEISAIEKQISNWLQAGTGHKNQTPPKGTNNPSAKKEIDYSTASMMDLFRVETEAPLTELLDGLLSLEKEGNLGVEQWQAMMRAAHSVKGAARMVEISAVVRIAHAMEDCFVAAQNQRLQLRGEDVDFLLKQADQLKLMLAASDEQLLGWEAAHEAELSQVEKRIQQILASSNKVELVGNNVVEKSEPLTDRVNESDVASSTPAANRSSERALRVSPARLNRMLGLTSEIVVEGRRLSYQLQALAQIKQQQSRLVAEINRLRSKLSNIELDSALLQQLRSTHKLAEDLRESLTSQFTELQTHERRAQSLSDQLHFEVLASRMRPFSDVTQALPRLVRDLGRNLGKEVRLTISGLGTLVDRDVLERIDTPLKHLVQNAVDHGIELPGERQRVRKTAEGELRLQISQSAGMLFVVLADDGAGIDLNKLRRRIISKKLATANELAPLDEMELLDFLFVPGFSTRTEVNQYSGRGVGLDIVKDTVKSLGGSIHASTTPGVGTRFQMLLPLSISVIRVLQTTICGEAFSIPLGRIHRLLVVPSSQLQWQNNHSRIQIDGRWVNLFHANSVFGGRVPDTFPDELDVIVLGQAPQLHALVVERIFGEQEVSQQRMDHMFGQLRGVSAATLLDDGSLSLIVDCDDLLQMFENYRRDSSNVDVSQLVARAWTRRRRVLIAEDSTAMCDIQRELLEAKGYEVQVVHDGFAAWDALNNHDYDLLISDIDMPGVDGLALLERLRANERSCEVAVLLLTRLDQSMVEKRIAGDRRTVYMNKADFDDQSFLSQIGHLLGWRSE